MNDTLYTPCLNVYLVWRQEPEGVDGVSEGERLADLIYSHFTRDVEHPLSRGLGIPLYFRSVAASAGSKLPAAIDCNQAERTAVVVLVSSGMVLDPEWGEYVRGLSREIQASRGRHLMIPVSLRAAALNFDAVDQQQFIRYYEYRAGEQQMQLLLRLAHELCRFLGHLPNLDNPSAVSPAPVKLFISHAKQDGQEMADAFRRRILDVTPAKNFFDAIDIAPGYNFITEIEGKIRESVLVVLQSDAYSSRPWCRREVLMAKRLQRPIIVVNALEHEERRSFPYLGNVPVIRLTDDNHLEIITLALLENLRFLYTSQRIEGLRAAQRIPAHAAVLTRAPEILDCRHLVPPTADAGPERMLVVYPDPPLGTEELEVLSEFSPGLAFTTLTMPTDSVSLMNRMIGLSISGSRNLAPKGFGPTHLRDAMIEFARHLLARGARVAYGGDLNREGSLTRILFDLVRAHNATGSAPYQVIESFLAWPFHLSISQDDEAALVKVATLERRALPEDLQAEFGLDPCKTILRDTAQNRYVYARCLTDMREAMNSRLDARLVLGGPLEGYSGKYPGILEEAYLAMRTGKPLFLVGAFGGCTHALIDLLTGGCPEELTLAYQTRDEGHAALVQEYNRHVSLQPSLCLEPIDYERLTAFFRDKGISGLDNGLTEEENRRLFEAVDLTEIIFLMLRGMSHVFYSS
jgi:hypothetical protein